MLFQPQHSEKQPISGSPRPCAGGYHQGNDSEPPNSAGAMLFGGRVAQRFSFLRVDWETTRDRAFSSKVGKLRRAKARTHALSSYTTRPWEPAVATDVVNCYYSSSPEGKTAAHETCA